MQKLINTEVMELLSYIEVLKEYYDDGGKTAINIFSNVDDTGEFEYYSYESLCDAAEFSNLKILYYREGGKPKDDWEPMCDVWFFSSCDMTEYYRVLNTLYRKKVINKYEYNAEKQRMGHLVHWYIFNGQDGYCGVSFTLRTKINHKYASSISVYLDADAYSDLFHLTCGIATIFDIYSLELKKLKKKYSDELDMKEE